MAGNLGFDELKAAVKAGSIDTVLVAMVDMQGRLVGKRFQAEYFIDGGHQETHACDYLLANDIDMEPVPGYAAASWDKGYGDFVLKPDLATLRRVPWLEGTALVLANVNEQPLSLIRRGGFEDLIGAENIVPNLAAALEPSNSVDRP